MAFALCFTPDNTRERTPHFIALLFFVSLQGCSLTQTDPSQVLKAFVKERRIPFYAADVWLLWRRTKLVLERSVQKLVKLSDFKPSIGMIAFQVALQSSLWGDNPLHSLIHDAGQGAVHGTERSWFVLSECRTCVHTVPNSCISCSRLTTCFWWGQRLCKCTWLVPGLHNYLQSHFWRGWIHSVIPLIQRWMVWMHVNALGHC